MTGTHVNPERHSFTVLLANQQRKRGKQGLGSSTPPPPELGKRGFPPLLSPVMPRQQPNG